jgi:conjugative transposon TraJ protein
MKKKIIKVALLGLFLMLVPALTFAQSGGVADDLQSLQGVLDNLYNQMMPMCSGMISVAQGIAGFAALWYIAARVWKHIAAAEPIDVYPLLRPFAIGFCIMFFPYVLNLMNGVLQPCISATQNMATNSNQAIATLLANQATPPDPQQEGATTMGSDPDKWYQYSHPDGTTTQTQTTNMSDQFSGWGWKNMIKKAIAELLNVLFEAAGLCIDTIRTFKLIVLAILGPLCFGLSVFDGFQHSMKQWIARYVNVYMWLPVANIFGAIIAKIQVNMIQLEQSGGAASPHFGDTNGAYLIFMVIGIIGYFTVPGIANYIMNVGGHALFSKTSALASMATSYIGGAMMQSFSQSSGKVNLQGSQNSGSGNNGGNAPPIKDKLSGSSGNTDKKT